MRSEYSANLTNAYVTGMKEELNIQSNEYSEPQLSELSPSLRLTVAAADSNLYSLDVHLLHHR
jgi:hypothetical protein